MPENVSKDQLLEDMVNDASNGNFKGWVYSSSITERDHRKKLSIVFMSIDRESISFWKNYTDTLPLDSF